MQVGLKDEGGTVINFMFGSVFGLWASYFFHRNRIFETEKKPNRYAYLISGIGIMFMFVYWPSMNAAFATGTKQERIILNTQLAIASSTMSAMACSRFFFSKISLDVMFSASLAGGTAIGVCAEFFYQPWQSLLLGYIVGIICCLDFHFLASCLNEKVCCVKDSSGVYAIFLHPGYIGVLASIIAVADT